MKKRALITGINGQDGSYLAEFLLEKGYEVFGTVKRNSVSETQTIRIDSVYNEIKDNLIYADLNDLSSLIHALKISDPDEVYNLAAQSHVRISFDQPLYTAQTTGIGVLNMLEAIRIHNPKIKMYQASSSEMFGNSIDGDGYQRETTPMNPVSPYGCFPGGTKILHFDKTINKVAGKSVKGVLKNKNIEDIREGDLVLSYNTETGVKEIKPVLSTMVRDNKKLYKIKFSNGNFIECTDEHPVYVHNKGWVEAKNLIISDKCIQYKYSGLSSRCNIGKKYSEMYSNDHISSIRESKSIKMKEKWNNPDDSKLDRNIYSERLKIKREINKESFLPWNSGLTANENEKIRNIAEKNKNYRASDLTKSRISEKNKGLWKDDDYIRKQINSRNVFPNKHEKKLIDIMNDICPDNFEYNGGYEKSFMIERKIPDFIHKSKKKIIEYFGNYWHNLPNRSTEQELKEIYRRNGYECMVIWQDDLFNDTEKIKQDILNFIYNKKTEVVDIVSIDILEKEGPVYNFEVGDNNNYYAYGILVHNCAKVFGYNICRNYRNSYGLFVSNGILFNHESPRRGTNFVTNKVCKEAVRIKLGLTDKLHLGNLDATRDWGHAKDYVEAMWMILQKDTPDDYVCSTGKSHSVRDLAEYVFGKLDLDWKKYIHQDPKFMRPEELDDLKGDCSKLKSHTGWSPKYTFETMLDEMVEFWVKEFSK